MGRGWATPEKQLKFWRPVGGWLVSRLGANGASLGGGLRSISGPRVTIKLRHLQKNTPITHGRHKILLSGIPRLRAWGSGELVLHRPRDTGHCFFTECARPQTALSIDALSRGDHSEGRDPLSPSVSLNFCFAAVTAVRWSFHTTPT